MNNPFAVDQSFVVSVKALVEIMTEISTEEERWWIEAEFEKSIVLGYNGLENVNYILFEFPKIASIPLIPDNDGEIICLYPISREPVQQGLYWQKHRLLNDEVRDWESFWTPLKQILEARYSMSSPARLNSSSSSS